MASRAASNARGSGADWRAVLRRSLRRSLELIGGGLLVAVLVFLALALVSYHQTDPSWSTAAGGGTAARVGGRVPAPAIPRAPAPAPFPLARAPGSPPAAGGTNARSPGRVLPAARAAARSAAFKAMSWSVKGIAMMAPWLFRLPARSAATVVKMVFMPNLKKKLA